MKKPVLKSDSKWTDEVLYYKGECRDWKIRRYEKSPDHPYRVNEKWVLHSRRVMERYLGRFLDPDEIVHHCDWNKKNDSIENLELVSRQMHNEIHNPKQSIPFSDEEITNALKETDYCITKTAELLGCPPALLWGGKCDHLYKKRNSPHFLKTNYEIVCSSCKEVGIPKTAKIFGTSVTTICHNIGLWQNEGLIQIDFLDSIRRKKPAGYVDENLEEICNQSMELGFRKTGELHSMNPESIRCAFRRLIKSGVLHPEFASQVIDRDRQRRKLRQQI